METTRTIKNIYPVIVLNRFRALAIDGRKWLGVESAIKVYLKENDLKIEDIEWKVADRVTILATTIEEFKEQFYALNINWDCGIVEV